MDSSIYTDGAQMSAGEIMQKSSSFRIIQKSEDDNPITLVYDDSFLAPGNYHFTNNRTLREKPKIFDVYRDALYSMSGEIELNGLNDEYTVHQDHELLLYEGNRRISRKFHPTPSLSRSFACILVLPSSTDSFDVSIITQTSYLLIFGVLLFPSLERLFYLSHMLHRWPGFFLSCPFFTSSPISVAVYMTDEESPYFDNFLKNTPLPHRLRLIQYRVLPPERARHHCVVYYDEVFEPFFSSSNLFHTTDQWGKNHTYMRRCENYQERIYPINRLRNLAIQNILTTHFLVLDMDMWPVGTPYSPFLIVLETTYQDIVTLPAPILRNEHLAMILPAFSLKSSVIEDCSSFQDCVEKAISVLPQTKEQLAACIDRGECTTFRPETLTHVFGVETVFHRIIWWMDGTASRLLCVLCSKAASTMSSKSLICL